MILAPGVSFDSESHQYWYKGKRLSGITGLIAEKLGTKMPEEFVGEHQGEGNHAHKAIETWIRSGGMRCPSVHPGVMWIVQTLMECTPDTVTGVGAEVLVSDFKKYASPIDIVLNVGPVDAGELVLIDVKKGVFKRQYLAWQLGIYKFFVEQYSPYKVKKCLCACLKDREYYPITPRSADEVRELLYGKK